ncbi:MAG: hypothetical protein K8R90_11385 [Candidatus Cloacimonetes bacterium]|nr:hypothetical protein [Candidatus Cloacimonadota bacterium]
MRKLSVTPVVRSADSPLQLLLNLEDAYNHRDIELYKQCLATSFRFVLIGAESVELGVDMDCDGLRDDWWDYDVEVRYHENLFGYGSSDGALSAPSAISLDLQIPPEEVWQQDAQDGYESRLIIPCYFDLRLTFAGNYQDIAAGGYALFFVVEKDGVWKIERWQDQSST